MDRPLASRQLSFEQQPAAPGTCAVGRNQYTGHPALVGQPVQARPLPECLLGIAPAPLGPMNEAASPACWRVRACVAAQVSEQPAHFCAQQQLLLCAGAYGLY